MADEYFAIKSRSAARYDIPAPLAREIGRFLVTWAHFEHYVQAIIWNCLQISGEQGRIAVREPRIIDRLDMIRDLGECQNLGMDFVLLKEIRTKAEPLAGRRHMLAHCLWQKLDNDWCAVVTRGTWQDLPIEIAGYYPVGVSKNLEPHGVPINGDDVRGWTERTILLIGELKKVGDQHRPVPLREKRKKRSAPKDQTHDHSGSKRKPPHPTSQG
jgi:hypothetical protein